MAGTEDHRMSLFGGRARSIDLVDRAAESERRRRAAMTAEDRLARLRAGARDRAADPPELGELIEDTGRQRLAAYYLYSAMLAGVLGTDLAPSRWTPELAEPVQWLGLTRFALEDQWELVALHLASTPPGGPPAQGGVRGPASKVGRRLADHAIPEAVSAGVSLAFHLHPIGTVAGLGTRLLRARIQSGRNQADAFRRLGDDLRALRARADGKLDDLLTSGTSCAVSQ